VPSRAARRAALRRRRLPTHTAFASDAFLFISGLVYRVSKTFAQLNRKNLEDIPSFCGC